jgi:uncharacterized repeat protein (TIGR01451 family)
MGRSRSRILVLLLVLAAASEAVAQTASVSVDVSLNGGSPPVAGADSTYTINVNNEGPSDAANVALSTAVPSGTTFVGLTAPAGWSCSTSSTIDCAIATFPPGSATFFLTVHVPVNTPPDTPITLNASVETSTSDPNPNDNAFTHTALVVWQSAMGVTKTAPATAFAGAAITYTINVTDNGPSNAQTVTLTDALPAAVLFQSINTGWTCSTPAAGANGTVSCSIAQLPLGSTAVTIQASTASATAPMTVNNGVIVAASTDPNMRTAMANTIITQSADIALTKSASALIAGADVTYTIAISNSGPSDASSVVMSDALPAGLTFQSINAPGWACTTPAAGSGGTVTCNRATFAPSSSSIALLAHVPAATPAGTTITNTATATSTTPDPSTPNTATASGTTGLQCDVAVTIADAPDPATAGGSLAYTLAVTNNGPSAAPNASVSVNIPASLGFMSLVAPAGWSCAALPAGGNGTITCTMASPLAVGTPASFTLNTTVQPGTPPGSVISTTASVSSAAVDPTPGNNSATATTGVTSPALLSATKQATGSGGRFFETAPFTYTIVITNSGISTQANNSGDEMVDQLPSSVTLVSATATSGVALADIVNNRVTWNGSILSGGSVTVTIQARVNSGTAGSTISNRATVAYDADGNGTNESTAQSNDVVFVPASAAAIPALSNFALIALALLLGLMAIRRLG